MNLEIKRNYQLKEMIKRKGWRQYEIAKIAGFDEALLSRHINGSRELTDENKEKLAKILEVKKEDI
jgi:plasmid maintenance system antidote protein VapI